MTFMSPLFCPVCACARELFISPLLRVVSLPLFVQICDGSNRGSQLGAGSPGTMGGCEASPEEAVWVSSQTWNRGRQSSIFHLFPYTFEAVYQTRNYLCVTNRSVVDIVTTQVVWQLNACDGAQEVAVQKGTNRISNPETVKSGPGQLSLEYFPKVHNSFLALLHHVPPPRALRAWVGLPQQPPVTNLGRGGKTTFGPGTEERTGRIFATAAFSILSSHRATSPRRWKRAPILTGSANPPSTWINLY